MIIKLVMLRFYIFALLFFVNFQSAKAESSPFEILQSGFDASSQAPDLKVTQGWYAGRCFQQKAANKPEGGLLILGLVDNGPDLPPSPVLTQLVSEDPTAYDRLDEKDKHAILSSLSGNGEANVGLKMSDDGSGLTAMIKSNVTVPGSDAPWPQGSPTLYITLFHIWDLKLTSSGSLIVREMQGDWTSGEADPVIGTARYCSFFKPLALHHAPRGLPVGRNQRPESWSHLSEP